MTGIYCRLVVLCALLLLQGCMTGNRYTYGYYSGKTRPTEPVATETPRNPPGMHIVEKGETLYSIAFACGEDVRTIAAWNRIQPPYTIYPNQQVRLTPPPAESSPRVRTMKKHISTPNSRVATKPYSDSSNTAKKTDAANNRKISWQWPTNGKIINYYSAKDTGKKGIDIAGKSGQPVYAAASGMVVYSGNGLRGYGRLVIIKHSDTYFSAYAHNRRLFVKEDQKVNKGQHIADMGSTESDRPLLHFEVRRDGKPVNPLWYLPKRH